MEQSVATLSVKRGREKPINNRHPWVFSGAISKITIGDPKPGELVDIVSSDGSWLAKGYYNPNSQIRVRILTWEAKQEIDEAFWNHKIQQAWCYRKSLQLEPATTAYRLINGEADGIPGLILDKYGDFLVFQALTAGIDKRKEMLIAIIAEIFSPEGIIERSDVAVRNKEGLPKVTGIRYGTSPPDNIRVSENGLSFMADIYTGHKTGLYLDQRENRAAVCQEKFVKDCDVLNVFAYNGGFAVYAAAAGARCITHIDSSADVLTVARENMNLNGFDRPNDEYIVADAFQEMRRLRESSQRFDMVILDPPKFASNKGDVKAAARGYKDINLLALKLLHPGGWLATFSCSGLIGPDLFWKILFGAAVDANRQVQVSSFLSQAADHPTLFTFPESHYLKGFLCRVL